MLPPPRRIAAVIMPALALAACGSGAPEPAGGVSKGEAEALAEAAEMLDETRTLPADAVPDEALPQPAPAAAPAAAAEMAGDKQR